MEALKNQRFTPMRNPEIHREALPEREPCRAEAPGAKVDQVASPGEWSSTLRSVNRLRGKSDQLSWLFGLTLFCKPVSERVPKNRTGRKFKTGPKTHRKRTDFVSNHSPAQKISAQILKLRIHKPLRKMKPEIVPIFAHFLLTFQNPADSEIQGNSEGLASFHHSPQINAFYSRTNRLRFAPFLHHFCQGRLLRRQI
jgi:hypothetical protein